MEDLRSYPHTRRRRVFGALALTGLAVGGIGVGISHPWTHGRAGNAVHAAASAAPTESSPSSSTTLPSDTATYRFNSTAQPTPTKPAITDHDAQQFIEGLKGKKPTQELASLIVKICGLQRRNNQDSGYPVENTGEINDLAAEYDFVAYTSDPASLQYQPGSIGDGLPTYYITAAHTACPKVIFGPEG